MAMKPIKLLVPIGFGKKPSLDFKWEYAVFYEIHDGRTWRKAMRHCKSREETRRFKRERKSRPWVRNMVVKRRLCQTHWEEYHDSFGWNAGCGQR